MKDAITMFDVEVMEIKDKINETITSARLKIFYKGENQNGSFISEEFSEKLLSTIAYSPIKGIYDAENLDFTNHGEKRSEGRIYGVVPVDYNLTWEEDIDGRSYACVDVYLYTALYEEANEIIGKSQSMELFVPSIKGEWKKHSGKMLYEYSDACFLGLQVLGDDVDPCFEGSAFFTLEDPNSYKNISILDAIFTKISDLEKQLVESQDAGGKEMNKNKVMFALSDGQKANKIFQAINKGKEYSDFYVHETYDKHAIVYNYAQDKFFRVNFEKNGDEVSVGDEMTEVLAVYVTKDESAALDTLREIKGTFTDAVSEFENLKNGISEKDTKIKELDNSLSTLQTEKETVETEFSALKEEAEALSAFKKEKEKEEEEEAKKKKEEDDKKKKEVFSDYSEKLDPEVIATYENKLDSFTATELEKELVFELVKNGGVEGLFSKTTPGYVPSDDKDTDEEMSDIAAIVSKYNKQ